MKGGSASEGMESVVCLGIDLSGPSNHADTCLAWRGASGEIDWLCHCSDADILSVVKQATRPVTVFIDAPLSYQDGGGYRPCDRALRHWLNQRGWHRLGVMPPTWHKMVYLTLRGVQLAQALTAVHAQVYETHPGASLLASGMDEEWVLAIKASPKALSKISDHWQSQGIRLSRSIDNDHQLMAIQALLSAEAWMAGRWHWQCGNWVV